MIFTAWFTNPPNGLFKSDFNIWSRVFSTEDLIEQSQSCGKRTVRPDVLDWSRITEADIQTVSPNILLERKDSQCGSAGTGRSSAGIAMIVPNRVSPKGGEFLCETLNAEMYIQETKREYYGMLNITDSSVLQKCPILFSPLRMNERNEWVDQNGKSKPRELDWSPSEPNGGGLQRCTDMRTENYAIYDVFCKSSGSGCAICKWTDKPVMLLKGLCSNAAIEYRFVLEIGDTHNRMLVFKGFNSLFVIYDKVLDRWVLSKSMDNSSSSDAMLVGHQVNKQPTPIGLQEWNMMDEDC